ncbi:MAG: Periplasmic pH-dependent serine endoprotease DegQ [Pseudomonadales bacterium]|nr:Periplasmic pH-dependent serine endoprotease DegQ [Pseudomonadales bacterium]
MKRIRMFAALTLVATFALGALARAAELPDFTTIVERNSGAVVKILSTQKAPGVAGLPPDIDPRMLEQMPEIFRHLFQYRGQPQRERQSMGSGFLISTDGYILTNHHVVDGADAVQVRLLDRREFDAKVIGSDRRSDIALLKIDAKNLPVVAFGDADELRVGEWVVAIGSPFGLDYSVTAGIVSARGRSLPSEDNANYVPFIQTDVAINPGNSGGPLFNLAGEVVGINSQIYTRSGGSIGLSFAIPISVAINVADQLKDSGHVVRGWLGVGIQDVDRALAESFGLEKPAGALISHLEPEGPAEKAGVRIGDIVTDFDGKPIEESADLPHIVGLVKPGTRAQMRVIRDGKPVDLRITVGELADEEGAATVAGASTSGGRLGLVVEDLDARQKSRLRVGGGVVVREVVAGKPGERAGLLPGDVITQIGRVGVRDAAAFRDIVAGLPAGTHVPVRLLRNGQAGFVAIRIEE